MTLSSENIRDSYAGNSSTTAFPITFIFWDNDDILALLRAADGSETTWVEGTNYTISGGDGTTGTLTAITVPATGETLVITSNRPLTQTNSYPLGGDFPSVIVEETEDKNVRLMQQVARDIRRAMKFPITDSTSLNTDVPSSTARAGKYLVFTAAGEIGVSSGTGNDPALRTDLADSSSAVLGDALIAVKRSGTGAVATTAHVVHERTEVVDVRDFGAVLDGVTNDFGAFRDAFIYLASRGYGTLLIPGEMAVASATWAAYGTLTWTGLGQLKIKGIGRDASSITITGSTSVGNGFKFENCGDCLIDSIEIFGNSQGGGGFGSFILVSMTAGATQDMSGFALKRCRMKNFKQSNWIRFHNVSATYAILQPHIDGNEFISQTGNSENPANIGETATMIAFGGGASSGPIIGASVRRNIADGEHVKRFCDSWAGARDIWIENNYLYDFGLTGAADDCAGYAVQVYQQSGLDPDNININFNRITGPRSCGIYCAVTAGNVNAIGNKISGQTDTSDSTLPKAAIAYNGAWGKIQANDISSCYGGIWSNGSDAKVTHISGNSIASAVTTGFGIRLHAATYGATTRQYANDNDIAMTGTSSNGYILDGRTLAPLGRIQITGGHVVAGLNGIFAHNNSGGGVVAQSVYIGGGIDLAGTCTNALISAQSSASYIQVHDVTLDGTGIHADATGLAVASSTNIDIDVLRCKNKTAGGGVMLALAGCQGRMRGVQFDNIGASQRKSGTDFGTAAPTWAAKGSTFIQNINAGQAAGESVDGWQNDNDSTTWTTRTYLAV